MNDDTAAGACASLFGLTSSASMLVEVSTAMITSTPRRVTVSSPSPHCGRASARIRKNAAARTRVALMIRRSRLALVESLRTSCRSPKTSSARRRRWNDRANRPIRTGRQRRSHRYSGAAKRIMPPGTRSDPAPPPGSRDRPQHAPRQRQLEQDQQGPGVQEPGELLGVAGGGSPPLLRALPPLAVGGELRPRPPLRGAGGRCARPGGALLPGAPLR